jgi:uncharacterized protein (TIRG00374 family)
VKGRGLRRSLPRALAVVFALACIVSLRAEAMRLTVTPLLHAWPLVLCAALLSLGNYLLRILRWRIYLARLGHPLPLTFTALSYTAGFAFTLSPAKLGELLRAQYYERRGVPVPKVAGAFLIERITDLCAATVLAAGIVLESARYHAMFWSAAGLMALALALLASMPWSRLIAAAEAARGVPRPVRTLLATMSGALAASQQLLRPGLVAFGFVAGVLAWGLEGVGLGVLSSAFPASHLARGTAVGIYSVALLAGAVSFLPGGLGGTEAVMTALLTVHGFPLTDSLLLTLVCRLVTLWLAVALGWLAVFLLRDRAQAMVPSWQ